MAGGDTGRSPWVEPGAQPSGNGSGAGTGPGSRAAFGAPAGPPGSLGGRISASATRATGATGPADATEAPASPWAPAAPPWAAGPPGPPPRGQGLVIAGIVVLSVVVVAAMVGVIVVVGDGDDRDDGPARGEAAADDGWVRDTDLDLVELAADGETVCTTSELDLFCLDGATGDELWTQQLPGQATSPTLVGDTLVVGSEGGPRHGDVYGYSIEGRRLWEATRLRDVDTGADSRVRRPALPAAGHVVAVLAGEVAQSEIVGVDARTGREAWRALGPERAGAPGGPIRPPVSDGDRFYATVTAGRSTPVTADDLRHLDPDDPADAAVLGVLDGYANADPANPLDPSDPEDLQFMVDAGVLDLVNAELAAVPVTSLVALDGATGEELWRTELDTAAYGVDAAMPVADGTVALVIGAESGRVIVVDVETGALRWEAPLTSDRASVAQADGVTVVAEGTTVGGFDDDGTELWRIATPGAGHDPDVPPGLTVEDGTLYAFGVDIFELDPDDGGSRVIEGSVAATDVALAGDHLVVAGVGLQGIPLRD